MSGEVKGVSLQFLVRGTVGGLTIHSRYMVGNIMNIFPVFTIFNLLTNRVPLDMEIKIEINKLEILHQVVLN